MSIPIQNENDQRIIDEMAQKSKSSDGAWGWDPQEPFAFALEQGASLELLAHFAGQYCCHRESPDQEYPSRCLPWVSMMLAQGTSKEQLRMLVAKFCFEQRQDNKGGGDIAPLFRHAFLADRSAWQVFETPEQFLTILNLIAKDGSCAASVLSIWCDIAYQFGRLRRPEVLVQTLWPTMQNANDVEENKKLFVETGKADAIMVITAAATHVQRVYDDQSLEAIKLTSVAAQIAAAKNHIPDFRGCILRGYVLTKHVMGTHEVQRDILYQVYTYLEERPDTAVIVYRWLLEGASQGGGLPAFFFLGSHETLKLAIERAGYTFASVTKRERPRQPGTFDLQVVLKGRGKMIVYKHVTPGHGARRENIQEGDTVIVPSYPGALLAVYSNPILKIYELELHPAKPPTYNMKNDGDIGRPYTFFQRPLPPKKK